MRKRFFAILLAASLLATLTACGDTSTNNEVESTENSESVVESTEPEEEEIIESSESETIEPEETETVEPESSEAATEDEIIEAEQPESEEPVVEEPAAPTYTYTDLSVTMYAQSSVNVRDLPSTDGDKLGGLSTNQEVQVTGQCNETSWYRISYNGSEAYVSNKYLGDNKVEVTQATTSNNSSITVSSGHWYDGYEMYTWYDMGEYYFAIVGNLDEAYEYLNTFPYSDVLESRYPDRTVVKGGTGPSDMQCAVVSACNMKSSTGAPIWSINYVWD